jgi:hypothetical protein
MYLENEKDSNYEASWLSQPDVSKEVIALNRDLTMPKRTVIVDTNYLIQVNKDEFASMLLDPKYEVSSKKSPQKKQMARLFRNMMERKIDLCFSNFIMREFIGRVPKKRDLLEILKRHIVFITPKENFESNFMDLAAAIDSCMNQSGYGCGDVKDTYSYILSVLAGVAYFVTEDKDLKRTYGYFSDVATRTFEEKKKEISKIKDLYNAIRGSSSSYFPLERVLEGLFLELNKPLTVPISLVRLENSLPLVLDKFDTIVWIFRSINEIEWLKRIVRKLPDDWDYGVVERAKKRIVEIAQSLGFESYETINESSLKTRLIELESKWSQQTTDDDIGYDLDSQFQVLQMVLYQEELEDTKEYADLEEYFTDKEDPKTFRVRCEQCSHEFELDAWYEGIVCVEQREMGPESYHKWGGEEECPNCGADITVEHEVYEYPMFFQNDEDTICDGCEVLPEKVPEEPPSTTLEDFM